MNVSADIPNVGNVSFPDNMSLEAIETEANSRYRTRPKDEFSSLDPPELPKGFVVIVPISFDLQIFITNHATHDYRLFPSGSVSIFEQLQGAEKEVGDLVRLGPVFVPAGHTVLAILRVKGLTTEKVPRAKGTPPAEMVRRLFAPARGFIIFDSSTHYEIDLPF